MAERPLTAAEFAAELRTTRRVLMRLANRHKVPYGRIGGDPRFDSIAQAAVTEGSGPVSEKRLRA